MVAVLELEPPPPERVGNVDFDLVALERLHEVAVGAELENGCGELGVVDAGGHQHRDVGVVLADPARQVGARLAGHVHVTDDDGEAVACEQPARLRGVGRGLALPLPARGDHARDHLAHRLFVVDYQHPLGTARQTDGTLEPAHSATSASRLSRTLERSPSALNGFSRTAASRSRGPWRSTTSLV